MIMDFPQHRYEAAAQWYNKMLQGMDTECPPQPRTPAFVPKHPILEKLDDYSKDFPKEYWDKWVFCPYVESPESWIDPVKVYDMAWRLNHPDMDRVRRVCHMLDHGADIGARGASRLPAMGPNIGSCFENGWEMMDAMYAWTSSRTVCGPLTRDQIPPNIRCSPMSVDIKPSGRARIIVDLRQVLQFI